MVRAVGVEPTNFHRVMVVPYQLGQTRIEWGGVGFEPTCDEFPPW